MRPTTQRVERAGVTAAGESDVQPDAMRAIREVFEREARQAPVHAATNSRRAAKKLHQKERRMVRMSNTTVSLLRSVGSLPVPVVAPASVVCYSPFLMTGGKAVG